MFCSRKSLAQFVKGFHVLRVMFDTVRPSTPRRTTTEFATRFPLNSDTVRIRYIIINSRLCHGKAPSFSIRTCRLAALPSGGFSVSNEYREWNHVFSSTLLSVAVWTTIAVLLEARDSNCNRRKAKPVEMGQWATCDRNRRISDGYDANFQKLILRVVRVCVHVKTRMATITEMVLVSCGKFS